MNPILIQCEEEQGINNNIPGVWTNIYKDTQYTLEEGDSLEIKNSFVNTISSGYINIKEHTIASIDFFYYLNNHSEFSMASTQLRYLDYGYRANIFNYEQDSTSYYFDISPNHPQPDLNYYIACTETAGATVYSFDKISININPPTSLTDGIRYAARIQISIDTPGSNYTTFSDPDDVPVFITFLYKKTDSTITLINDTKLFVNEAQYENLVVGDNNIFQITLFIYEKSQEHPLGLYAPVNFYNVAGADINENVNKYDPIVKTISVTIPQGQYTPQDIKEILNTSLNKPQQTASSQELFDPSTPYNNPLFVSMQQLFNEQLTAVYPVDPNTPVYPVQNPTVSGTQNYESQKLRWVSLNTPSTPTLNQFNNIARVNTNTHGAAKATDFEVTINRMVGTSAFTFDYTEDQGIPKFSISQSHSPIVNESKEEIVRITGPYPPGYRNSRSHAPKQGALPANFGTLKVGSVGSNGGILINQLKASGQADFWQLLGFIAHQDAIYTTAYATEILATPTLAQYPDLPNPPSTNLGLLQGADVVCVFPCLYDDGLLFFDRITTRNYLGLDSFYKSDKDLYSSTKQLKEATDLETVIDPGDGGGTNQLFNLFDVSPHIKETGMKHQPGTWGMTSDDIINGPIDVTTPQSVAIFASQVVNSQNQTRDPYYCVNINIMNNKLIKPMSETNNDNNVSCIISNYYNTNNYTISQSGDSVAYVHVGEPIPISALGIKILNKDGKYEENIGNKSHIILQLNKASPPPASETATVGKKSGSTGKK